MVWLVIAVILGISLLPHIGIVLLSFAKVWSFSLLPTTYTLGHYEEILFRVPHFVINTLIYTLLAAALDVVLGAAIAFLLAAHRRARPQCARRHRHHAAGDSRCRFRGRLSASISRLGLSRRRRAR